jgi:hypothetical protein
VSGFVVRIRAITRPGAARICRAFSRRIRGELVARGVGAGLDLLESRRPPTSMLLMCTS